MAEAAVAIVTNKAIAAKALLKGEGHHLQENLSWIETQMKALQSYLKDAESKNAVQFMNSIRDFALDVEDSLDTCLLQIESHKSKGSFGFSKHSPCIPCYGGADNDFSRKIEKFKKRAAEIEQSRGDIAAESNVDGKFGEKTKKFKKKDFQRKETEMVKAKISGGDEKCRIISIIGPGGVGKTTLARKVYHGMKSKFECSAKVYISEDSTLIDLLIDIANQVGLVVGRMKQNLQENLQSFLYKKKYVIFLDDFSNKWDALRDAVMTNSEKHSRIIITCREPEFEILKDDLGSKEISDDSITLKYLSDSEGEKLFYDSMEEALSPELKNIGDKIVRKCGGLPLAIHVAAGLLNAKERSESSWNEVLQRMNLDADNGSFNMMLDLSYQDLPTKLKPFFLYFGIFPMNREIFVNELIKFWIAEKLVIQTDESSKPDKIAEDYIDELIDRNLIQVSRRGFEGRVKTCSIQNLLHDLCNRKAKESNFFCNLGNRGNADIPSTARRVIAEVFNPKSTVPEKLRALLCFSKGKDLPMFIQDHASELRFLQILSIEVEYKAVNIPTEIADLSGLTYLKIKGQNITVPSSVRKLKRLQTLEVRTKEVPESILKMKYLTRLFLSGVIIVKPTIRERGEGLEIDLQNLETLDFDYKYGHHLSPSSLKKLPSLKKLNVVVAATLTLNAFSCATQLSQKLEELNIRVDSASDIPEKVDLSSYTKLRTLYLIFDNSNPMCSFEFPDNLVKITLEGIDTEGNDPLKKLAKLPSLETIRLKNCIARKIDFSGEGNFPQLQMLKISNTSFQRLVADEKGMRNLSKFIYKPRLEQASNLVIPMKLRKVMVQPDGDDLISSSTSSDEKTSWFGSSLTQIQSLRSGFEATKRALKRLTGLTF